MEHGKHKPPKGMKPKEGAMPMHDEMKPPAKPKKGKKGKKGKK